MSLHLPTGQAAKRVAVHAAGAAMVLIVVAVFYHAAYRPVRDDVLDRWLRIERVKALTVRAPQITRQHQEMTKQLTRLSAAAASTRLRLPTDPSSGDFAEHATRLAAELGMEVQQMETGLVQPLGDFATVDVRCRLAGDYASMCRYLAAIDQFPQLSRVTRLDVARTADSRGYPVEVTFQLYYQVDPHDKDQQQGTL